MNWVWEAIKQKPHVSYKSIEVGRVSLDLCITFVNTSMEMVAPPCYVAYVAYVVYVVFYVVLSFD